MTIIEYPDRNDWQKLCRRNIPADDPQVDATVAEIVDHVRREGDKALREYALQFDHTALNSILLPRAEYDALCDMVAPEVQEAIRNAAANIERFHKAQVMEPLTVETVSGVTCMQRQVAIQTVGLYIPGGRAPLFSTVLMLGVPARIAGCKRVVLCTPRSSSLRIAPEIAYAARVCGIEEIYQIGGAQAIAAMAYGTESVPRVDKIFGPGNRFVTKAKQLVSTDTAIDMPAGPSEVMVLADETANPVFVASDLLSQAEHGPDSQAILVTTSLELAHEASAEVERQMALLKRRETVERSLSQSRVIVLDTREAVIEFANLYASEHLIISMRDPWDAAAMVTAAGSVFIGNYSPESAGDYASGTNHTLPTSAWARAYSGVNIDSFTKKITYQELTPSGLASISGTIIAMANAEGLDAHAAAVKLRLGLD